MRIAEEPFTGNISVNRSVIRPVKMRVDSVLKRGMDIGISIISLLLLSPVFVFVAILIRRDSPGPIFYRGQRAGRNGRIFHILKFRTMYEKPECFDGPKVTAQDDPRITSTGHWLRSTKLNELPQLWNVLKGEMSLVGPRPEDPDIVAAWPEDVRNEVLSVCPGISSPASVLYRNEETMLEHGQVMNTYLDKILPSKLRLDQLYVRNRSIWLDLDILFWTALVLLPKIGSFTPPEDSLFLGPISRIMRRYISWFIWDLITTFFAFGVTGVLWRSFGPLNVGWQKGVLAAMGFALLFSIVGTIFGVNRVAWSKASSSDVWDLFAASAVATALALLGNYVIGPQPLYPPALINSLYPPALVLIASGLSLFGFIVVRYRSRLLSGLAYRWLQTRKSAINAREKVLIIGGGTTGQFVAWFLNNGDQLTVFHVVGFVDDDLYKQGMRVQGVQVLGKREDIPHLVRQHDIGILIFAIHNIHPDERDTLLKICAETNARVVMMPDILAALNAAVRNGRVSDCPDTAENQTAEPEVGMAWPGIPPGQVRSWLDELDTLVQHNDLPRLRSEIQAIRELVRVPGLWVDLTSMHDHSPRSEEYTPADDR